jgi:hypothetical protein
MPVAKVKEAGASRVVFEAGGLQVEVVDIGAGALFMVPEWGQRGLVLQKEDVNRLRLLCQAVMERP